MLEDPKYPDSGGTNIQASRPTFVLCRGGELDGKRFALGRSQTLVAGDEIAPLGLPYIYGVTAELVSYRDTLGQVARVAREYVRSARRSVSR
jgi:hypothetical protein